MGNVLSVAGWVTVATIILIVMAILILVATNRVRNLIGNTTNTSLQNIHSKLVWAQVFAWIAVGVGVLLVLGYIFLHFVNTTEWIHLILWILLFAALITSGVFLAIALSDIDKITVNNDNGVKSYIWGALIAGLIALIILLISGGWRVATRQGLMDQYYVPYAEPAYTGLPMDPAEVPMAGNLPGGQIQVTTNPMI